MSNEALALVVAGAFFHSLWNLFAKKASGGLPFVWLFGLVSLTVAFPFGVAAWRADSQQLSLQAWIVIACSGLVHVTYSLVLQKAYRTSDFSIVYPLTRGTGALFTVVGAIAVLGEGPTLLGWLGIGAVLLGIFLLSGIARMGASPSASSHRLTGVFWGCLSGLVVASHTLIDGWALKTLGLAPVLYFVLTLALRTLVLAPQALRHPESLRAQWQSNKQYIIAVGVLSPLAYVLVLFAVAMAPLSYIAPIRELSMLIGVVMGAHLLREALQPARVMGAACMVLGVVLLAQAH